MTYDVKKCYGNDFLVIILFSLVMSLLIVIAFTKYQSPKPTETIKPIKSLVLNIDEQSYTSGSFILGFGSIQSATSIETKYYIYIMGDEGYKLTEIDSSHLEIVETDDVKPCIKIIDDGYGNRYYYDYVVYVPLGTITQEYKATISTEMEDMN